MAQHTPIGPVVVQVIEIDDNGREISMRDKVVEQLKDRVDSVRDAIVAGTEAISAGLDQLPSTKDWEVRDISAKFGVTLTADAGVLLSSAGAEATFEVTVTLQRK